MMSYSCVRGRYFTTIPRCRRMQYFPLRHATQSHGIHKTYYDTLGLHYKATPSEIKQAYYKLSLKYHPDMSPTEGERFREITAAYEVLGNLKLRRLYDRGALHGGQHLPPPEPSQHNADLESSFDARVREKSLHTGRTTQYNFDEWSKAHYGKVLHRNEKTKQKLELRKATEKYRETATSNPEVVICGIFLVLVAIGWVLYENERVQLDKVRKKPNGKDR